MLFQSTTVGRSGNSTASYYRSGRTNTLKLPNIGLEEGDFTLAFITVRLSPAKNQT
jgi:hypothetical protein